MAGFTYLQFPVQVCFPSAVPELVFPVLLLAKKGTCVYPVTSNYEFDLDDVRVNRYAEYLT